MNVTVSKEIGTLVVVVLKARNLPDKHTFTKQDPYTVVRLGGTGKNTQIDKRGGQHPVWDEEIHLPVFEAATSENRTLKVSVFSQEPKLDALIGEGQVDISETLRTGEFDDWVKVGQEENNHGEVYLEMTFFAAGPAPQQAATNLQRRPSKLPPSERLWRPPIGGHTPPRGQPPSLNTSPQVSPHQSPNLRPNQGASLQVPGAMPIPSSLAVGVGSPAPGAGRAGQFQRPPQNQAPAPPPRAYPAALQASSPPRANAPLPPSFPMPPPLSGAHSTGASGGPSYLTPNGYPQRPSSASNAYLDPNVNVQHTPSILRPGNARSSPTPIPERQDQRQHQGGYFSQSGTTPPRGQDPLAFYSNKNPPPLPLRPNETLPDPFQSYNNTAALSSSPSSPHAGPSYLNPAAAYSHPTTASSSSNSRPASNYAQAEAEARQRLALHRASQETADAELARLIARNEGIDVEMLRAQERDEEIARKLERELNDAEMAKEATAGGVHMPGEW